MNFKLINNLFRFLAQYFLSFFSSSPFYALLLVLFLFVYLLNSFSSFFSLINIIFFGLVLVHGWCGLRHVLEDYTFSVFMRPLFLFLLNLSFLKIALLYFLFV